MRGEGARVSIREERREGFTICPFLNSVVGLHQDEAGQGLIEYVLVLGLIGLSAVAAMKVLASGMNSAISKLGSLLTSAIS
jgi:Flp pilus assembly pilin Flp